MSSKIFGGFTSFINAMENKLTTPFKRNNSASSVPFNSEEERDKHNNNTSIFKPSSVKYQQSYNNKANMDIDINTTNLSIKKDDKEIENPLLKVFMPQKRKSVRKPATGSAAFNTQPVPEGIPTQTSLCDEVNKACIYDLDKAKPIVGLPLKDRLDENMRRDIINQQPVMKLLRDTIAETTQLLECETKADEECAEDRLRRRPLHGWKTENSTHRNINRVSPHLKPPKLIPPEQFWTTIELKQKQIISEARAALDRCRQKEVDFSKSKSEAFRINSKKSIPLTREVTLVGLSEHIINDSDRDIRNTGKHKSNIRIQLHEMESKKLNGKSLEDVLTKPSKLIVGHLIPDPDKEGGYLLEINSIESNISIVDTVSKHARKVQKEQHKQCLKPIVARQLFPSENREITKDSRAVVRPRGMQNSSGFKPIEHYIKGGKLSKEPVPHTRIELNRSIPVHQHQQRGIKRKVTPLHRSSLAMVDNCKMAQPKMHEQEQQSHSLQNEDDFIQPKVKKLDTSYGKNIEEDEPKVDANDDNAGNFVFTKPDPLQFQPRPIKRTLQLPIERQFTEMDDQIGNNNNDTEMTNKYLSDKSTVLESKAEGKQDQQELEQEQLMTENVTGKDHKNSKEQDNGDKKDISTPEVVE